MRESAPESKSPASFLSQCLVEGDPAARASGRRTRWASVAASLAMQAVLLTVLIIVPLFAAGKLPAMQFDPPMPIYTKGDPGAPPPVERPSHGGGGGGIAKRPVDTQMKTPTHIPQSIAMIDDRGEGPPRVSDAGPGVPWGDDRIGIPFTDGTERPSPPPPPTTTARPKPMPVSTGVMEARLIHRVMPIYPALARHTKTGGNVELRAIIGKDGRVHSMEVVSGHPLLIRAALEAVQQWRYTPTLLSGEPVEVDTIIVVKFVLSQ